VHPFPPYCSLPWHFNIQNFKHYFIFSCFPLQTLFQPLRRLLLPSLSFIFVCFLKSLILVLFGNGKILLFSSFSHSFFLF
jgi:hypothetical protein